jgi:hypothetical protein
VTGPVPEAWQLDGRVALLTVAQRGIGFSAKAFVSVGAAVACVDPADDDPDRSAPTLFLAGERRHSTGQDPAVDGGQTIV